MTRVKRGFVARRRRKKVLQLTKGFRGSSRNLFRVANQRKIKALIFTYRDRRRKKIDLRRLWISRINASARNYGLNYNQLMFHLKQQKIALNRKWLAQLAVRDPMIFSTFLKQVFI